jgi:hypothetical protein
MILMPECRLTIVHIEQWFNGVFHVKNETTKLSWDFIVILPLNPPGGTFGAVQT